MLRADGLWPALAQLAAITGKADFRPEYLEPMRGGLERARLWWVGADAVDLIESAAPTMPPATLTQEFAPDPEGFVWFQRPIVSGHDADQPDLTIAVDAVQWFPTVVMRADGTENVALSIVSWQHVGTIPLALGRADWPYDWDTDRQLPEMADGVHASIVEDRRLLAALWQLSSQAGLTEAVDRQPDRATVKRLTRAQKAVPEVRCVNLAPHRRGPRDGDSEASERTYRRRWIVEGHWRQQACGPGYSQRRPVFIAPYVKGPDDAPLIVPDTVKVWR